MSLLLHLLQFLSDDADALCYNNDLGRITDLLKIAQEGLILDELSLVDGYVFFYCHEIVGARVFNRLLTIKVSDKVSKGFEKHLQSSSSWR